MGRKASPEQADAARAVSARSFAPLAALSSRLEPKYFINAALHGPDAIILDLEDSVHHAEKDAARILVRNACAAVDFGKCERMVRINQLPIGTGGSGGDCAGVTRSDAAFPRWSSRNRSRETDRMIGELKSRYGITRPIWLMPILESALGIENASAIATASKNVVALTIGLEDYTADLGVAKTAEGARVAVRAHRVW